jgi:serine/threonine protein phosphatase PrpC
MRYGGPGNWNIPQALIESFRATDTDFEKFSNQRGLSPNVGSVVVVTIIIGDYIFCANLGDARAILAGSSSRVIELSRDMKPNVAEETKRILGCGGHVVNNRVNGRLAVSRAIGDFEFKNSGLVSNAPEIRCIRRVSPEDEFIVMACDGLFDVMSSEEVVEFIRNRIDIYVKKNQEPDPNQIAVDLVTESIMKRNTSDNVTVLIIFLRKFT